MACGGDIDQTAHSLLKILEEVYEPRHDTLILITWSTCEGPD